MSDAGSELDGRIPTSLVLEPVRDRARGVDVDNPGTALDRSGTPTQVPRVTGPIARRHPVQLRDLEFLKAHTSKRTRPRVASSRRPIAA